MVQQMAVCYFHPDRAAVGICVRCRTNICAACSTRLDGINHCHRCLGKLAARGEGKPGAFATGTVVAVVAFAVAWLALFGLFWLAGGTLAPHRHAVAPPAQGPPESFHAA
jgi:hypothetical protein